MSTDSVKGLVVTGRNNIFTVRSEGEDLLCRLKGKRLSHGERAYNPLAPGDYVMIASVDWNERSGSIERRLDRSNAFVRFNRKRMAPQIMAANIGMAVCIASVREPEFRSRFVDRFLALCEDQDLPAALVVTKSDLDRRAAARVVSAYRKVGYDVVAASSKSGAGVREVRARLERARCVLVGQSGVGKSSLINRLVGSEAQTVRDISRRYGRGRHTTTAAKLVMSDGFEIVDTPGIRELDCRTIAPDHLDWCFREFRGFLGHCGHVDCHHLSEPESN